MAKDPYEVLGLRRGASQQEIREAYLALVKKYHPDNYQGHPLSELATEKIAEINEAYDTLTAGNRQQESSSSSDYSQHEASGSRWGGSRSSSQGPYYGSRKNSSCCQDLACCCLADSCCECLGGDLIPCC